MPQFTYSKKVLEHFQNPHNQGKIEDATVIGEVGNRICGDVMKLYLKIDKEVITDIKFETLGCAAAIATSSIITDFVKGKTVREAEKVTADNITEGLEGLPPIKVHCSLLSVDALKDALLKFKKLKK